MNLEQMKAAHRQQAEDEPGDVLGPMLLARHVLPPWMEDTIKELSDASEAEGEEEESFEDLDDQLEASLQDSVELLHQAMDLLGKYGQRRHAVTVDVKKEFVEMAQRIFETLDQYHLLEETHR